MDKYKELTFRGKDAYIQALRDTGWFEYSNLTESEISERLDAAEPENFMICLYDLWFDTEGFEDDDAYRWLMERILSVIKLDNPVLTVNYLKETNSVDIKIDIPQGSYLYTVRLDDHGGWDEDVIDDFINNRVLGGKMIEHRLIALPPTDQSIQFVFIPRAVYDKAAATGIIPDSPDYFMKAYL